MIKTSKIKTLSIALLAVVMAVTFAFGIITLGNTAKSVTKVDADATPVMDILFNGVYSTSTYSSENKWGIANKDALTSVSFNSTGILQNPTSEDTNYITYNMATNGGYIKYNTTSSTASSPSAAVTMS